MVLNPRQAVDQEIIDPAWTFSSLRLHTDIRHDALRDSVEDRFRAARELSESQNQAIREALVIALSASKEAISKSESSVERRFDSVNEFRASLSDAATRLISRAEVEVLNKASSEKIDTLTSRLDRIQGQTKGTETSWSTITTSIGIITALAMAVMSFAYRPDPATAPPYASTTAALNAQSARIEALSQRLGQIKQP